MAESGIDLSYDDRSNDSSQPKRAAMSKVPSSSTSGSRSTMVAGQQQQRVQKTLRTTQRMALAKQQAEQLQQRQRSTTQNGLAPTVAVSQLLSSVRPLPVIQAESMGLSADDQEDVVGLETPLADVAGQTAPTRFSFPSVPTASHMWSNSAPDSLTICLNNLTLPSGSAATSYSELDEQLDDIESSIGNELGTPQSYLSGSSVHEGSYRGGRKKEPPPPNMTPEQKAAWQLERMKKDTHNDIEKRRRYKINECIQELGNMLPSSYDTIFKEPANSKGAILQATVDYIRHLQSDQHELVDLKARVDKLEQSQRQLLLQREALRAALAAATTPTQSMPPHVPQLLPVATQQTHQQLSAAPSASSSLPSPASDSQSTALVVIDDGYMLPLATMIDYDEVGMDVTATFCYGDDVLMVDQHDFGDHVYL